MKIPQAFLLVWRNAAMSTLRGKRLFALLALSAAPLLVGWLNVAHGQTIDLTDFVFTFLFVIATLTVPFGALVLGIAVIGDEVDQRTITYLYTRPVPRPVYFVARLFGFIAAYGLFIAITTVLCASIYGNHIRLSATETAGAVAIALAGFAVYTSVFALLRVLFKKALYIGFLLTFVIEIWLSKMPIPGGLTRLSVWHHLSVFLERLFQGRTFDMPVDNIVATETVGGSALILVGVFVVSVAASCWLVRVREVRVPAAVG
ncbi:MAG: ABC transporter permease subunit [Planctomycetota bacterium]|jgi:ABC-type transport system involved in multi-copper enzyme maturation permease subunit